MLCENFPWAVPLPQRVITRATVLSRTSLHFDPPETEPTIVHDTCRGKP